MSALAELDLALPTRTVPRGAGPLECLLDEPIRRVHARGCLTPRLIELYDGDLSIPLHSDRPTVVANFVETIDGVIAMDASGRTGGGEVSGFSPTDRFVMGLLRSLADVVLVGGASVRRSSARSLSPASVFPREAGAFRELRASLGLAPAPTTVIATATGDLEPNLPIFRDAGSPVVIAAPMRVADNLRSRGFPEHVSVERLDRAGPGGMADLLEVIAGLGGQVVVSEAGPRLFGELLHSGLVDELFLTVAPQIAGRRSENPRLGLVEDVALWPDHPRWSHLVSLRRSGNHLFTRYRFV